MAKSTKKLTEARGLNFNFEYTVIGVHVTRYAEQLGYTVNPEGICNGLACMSMQAILADDLDTFNQRISLMIQIRPNDFKQVIENIEKKRLKKHPLTREEALLADSRMFFDGLVAYQDGGKFLKSIEIDADLNQNPLEIAPITWPARLNTEEQSLVEIGQFSGVYMDEQAVIDERSQDKADVQQIARYLTFLRDTIKEISPPLSSPPIVLHLSVALHIICISYDPKKEQWAFINAAAFPDRINATPVKFCSDIRQMADLIYYSLAGAGLSPIFTTSVPRQLPLPVDDNYLCRSPTKKLVTFSS